MLPAAFLFDHPRTQHPRWPMPHMLRVTAGKIGHPVFVFILVKPHDDLRCT